MSNVASVSTGSPLTTIQASGVRAGTYYIRVRAQSATEVSDPSNEAVLVVAGGGPCSSPDAPTGLTIVSNAARTVTLRWNAPSGNPTTYVIEAGSRSGLSDLANSDLGSPATSLTRTGVGPGTFFVRIRARNACGSSPPSNEVMVTSTGIPTPAPPQPPPSPTPLPTPPAPNPSPAGTWNGATSQGLPITFQVSAGRVVKLSMAYRVPGNICTGEGTTEITFAGGGLAITNNAFAYSSSSGPINSINGTFTSGATASGTAVVQMRAIPGLPPCSGTATLTWNVTRSSAAMATFASVLLDVPVPGNLKMAPG